jgi:type IV pilus assembly protein PilV
MDELRRSKTSERRRGRRRIAGLTLVEVMMALAILSLGLMAMLGMQVQAMRGGKTGLHTTRAAQIARDRMEFFHRIQWTDPDLADTTGWLLAGEVVTDQVETLGGGTFRTEQAYTVDWEIQDLAADLKQIDVRVTWREPTDPSGRAPRRFGATSMRFQRQ